jgi:hypothetical protein
MKRWLQKDFSTGGINVVFCGLMRDLEAMKAGIIVKNEG